MEDRRIRVDPQTRWTHHRSGWREATEALHRLHHPKGIRFEGFLEQHTQPVLHPFVGMLHHTPRHPSHLHPWDQKAKYGRHPDLNRFFSGPVWKASEPFCRGLYTLSGYTAAYARARTSVPIHSLVLPRRTEPRTFQWRGRPRRLLFIGSWMRDYRGFLKLEAPHYRKTFVLPFKWNRYEIDRLGLDGPPVHCLTGISGWRYDRLLRHSVAFLQLFDAAAVNTVLDCLFFHTPLVINRLPAVEEYLGEDYPLFYSNLSEAEHLLQDTSRLEAGHRHLATRDKTRFKPEAFAQAVQLSTLYQTLPECRS